MVKVFYKRVGCPECPECYKRNKGLQVQWKVSYEITGIAMRADNKPSWRGGDVLDWQVKSPKASLSDKDNCKGYIFGFVDTDFFYEMTISEFEQFASEFSYNTYDSSKNGAKAKRQIKNDSQIMRRWLEEKAR